MAQDREARVARGEKARDLYSLYLDERERERLSIVSRGERTRMARGSLFSLLYIELFIFCSFMVVWDRTRPSFFVRVYEAQKEKNVFCFGYINGYLEEMRA